MNKAQEKILEAVGLLSSNRQRFSSFSKEHAFGLRESKGNVRVPSFVCAQENGCLVLAESWFRERGLYLSWGSLGAAFFAGMFIFIFFRLGVHNGLLNAPAILSMVFSFIILLLGEYPLFFAARSEIKLQGLQYCIFSSSSKEVFFVSEVDFQPRICRWDECTFCLAYSAGSIEGYYYELKGYLFNEDGSVKDSFSFDDYHYMVSNSDNARQAMIDDLSARFEYVRRFMEEGPDSVEPVSGRLNLRPSLSEAAHRFQPRSSASDGKKIHFIYSAVRMIFLIPFSVQVVGHYFFCRYCRLPQWPQAVIDECGEEVFPKR